MTRLGTCWTATHSLGLLLVWVALAVNVSSQVKTETSTASQDASSATTVERGEVAYVSGNKVIVKMEDGTLRDFPNVPESARVTVDGKELGVHDLKVGMKLEKTLTTTTTPKTITTVQSVTGKVWHVNPPKTVVLTLEDGTNQQFNIPEKQKFNINGEMVDAWGLKKGMKVTATKIVEEPVVEVSQQAKVSGELPPPPPTPPADVPILVAAATVPPPPSSAAPAELPKTGSSVPLIGLFALLSIGSWIALRAIRSTL